MEWWGWRQAGPIAILAAQLLLSPANVSCGLKPQISEMVDNVTVALGRDTILRCQVKHLADYKVAWIHIDRQMILTIGKNVITRIPRFNIIHDNHHSWSLQIKDVQAEDRGYYMCQVNTDPMISVTGHLDVVVPPSIVDEESSASEVSIREKHNITLSCKANGVPMPKITWRREDGRVIFRDPEKRSQVGLAALFHGEHLELQDVSREQMGAYLCIASNKVPPSVSKRIKLVVEFAPMMYIPNQLIGAPLHTQVTVECVTEASPKAITYWVFNDVMILKSPRHDTEEEVEDYKLHSRLTIFDIEKEDFGMYKCVSKNSLGETESTLRLYEVTSPIVTTTLSYYDPHLPTVGGADSMDYPYDQQQMTRRTTRRVKTRPTRHTSPAPSPTQGKIWWDPTTSGFGECCLPGSPLTILLAFYIGRQL